tara:strand:- start:240 stop:392 length:153 start_codon:yes stop_codon:yes gene_type:complete
MDSRESDKFQVVKPFFAEIPGSGTKTVRLDKFLICQRETVYWSGVLWSPE